MPNHLQEIKNEKLQETVEEENRLFYVAITRAKNEVHLMSDLPAPSAFVEEVLSYD